MEITMTVTSVSKKKHLCAKLGMQTIKQSLGNTWVYFIRDGNHAKLIEVEEYEYLRVDKLLNAFWRN